MSFRVKKLHIGTNLKMYKNIQATTEYVKTLFTKTKDISREELCLFVLPSYTSLYPVAQVVNQDYIQLGAQNVFWEDYGQYTGEISPLMIKETGARIVEIGHSERRQHFGETDFTVNKKVLACLRHGFTTLICVGETAEEKRLNITVERLRQQVRIGLSGVREAELSRIWVAYEPVWAIGEQGVPANAEYAGAIHKVLRATLLEMFPDRGKMVPILYGGSVNKTNAVEFITLTEVDGLFIGRSAWEPAFFNYLIREVLPLWRAKTAESACF